MKITILDLGTASRHLHLMAQGFTSDPYTGRKLPDNPKYDTVLSCMEPLGLYYSKRYEDMWPAMLAPKHIPVREFEFDDVTDPQKPCAPTLKDAEGIVQWAEWNKHKKHALIHCTAGISRSSASAYLTRMTHDPSADPVAVLDDLAKKRDGIWPNELLVRYGAKVLGRDDLEDALEEWKAVELKGLSRYWLDEEERQEYFGYKDFATEYYDNLSIDPDSGAIIWVEGTPRKAG